MNKSDIENGYVVELRNETLCVRMGERLLAENRWMNFRSYTEELDYNYPDGDFYDSYDIIRVYEVKTSECTSLSDILCRENLTLIWDRFSKIDWNQVPKMTDIKIKLDEDKCIDSKFIAYIGNANSEPYLVQIDGEVILAELSTESYESLVEISKKEGK